MNIDIFQGKITTFSCIAEVHTFKINSSVWHDLHRVRLVAHLRHFIQYFRNTVAGRLGNHNHNEDKGYHHQ